MKKLIITLAFVALSSVSAKAIEMGIFSLTGGLASNSSVWGATAKQDRYNVGGTAITSTSKESGVFTDSYSSQLIELGIGRWISLGFEHVPDAISTPENINSDGCKGYNCGAKTSADTAKVSVDFNDFNTMYVKLNTPWGLYFKAGSVETSLDIKETMTSTSTYSNVSVDGTSVGAGYQKYIGDSGFGIRVEGNYVDLDTVSTTNGVALASASPTTNHKKITATGMEGLTAKVAVTYTFGRSNN